MSSVIIPDQTTLSVLFVLRCVYNMHVSNSFNLTFMEINKTLMVTGNVLYSERWLPLARPAYTDTFTSSS